MAPRNKRTCCSRMTSWDSDVACHYTPEHAAGQFWKLRIPPQRAILHHRNGVVHCSLVVTGTWRLTRKSPARIRLQPKLDSFGKHSTHKTTVVVSTMHASIRLIAGDGELR
ncbi:hypothetical protein AVEN_144715-1 [Araneus ventricosus]|uniref:Uncharacterized protein n=1 Tax=Araneus ventricosus TaxID=182803 RepID=A0A4Y2RF09_ARAVE|nr:hypothetical protein AVEN_144715-1 [Araneus ventricosus]